MQIVTSGSAYIDIDAYAGCIAYVELLQAQGQVAQAVSTAPLNESVTRTIRSWPAPLQTTYQPSKDDTFTLIDVSDPKFFDRIVSIDQITAVIDHHPGFEAYWQERLGRRAQIEFIGSACTQVYEAWQAAGLFEKMSMLSARLLLCGILDNTLNFGARITTPRDAQAYEELLKRADVSPDWTARYFMECQDAILQDAVSALKKDTKVLSFQSFAQPVCAGQLTVWDAPTVLAEHRPQFQATLQDIKPDWFLNLISVGERKSYLLVEKPEVQAWLTQLLGVSFEDGLAVAPRLWLRKEITKQDLQHG